MTIQDLHIAFKVEVDKNAINIGISGSPSFLPEEIDHWLYTALLNKISTKFTGNNQLSTPFEGSVKRVSDLEGLVHTDKGVALLPESDTNIAIVPFPAPEIKVSLEGSLYFSNLADSLSLVGLKPMNEH